MNVSKCTSEKYADRFIGLALLGLGLLLSISGFTVLPIVGFLVALPVLGISLLFVLKSPSDVCPPTLE